MCRLSQAFARDVRVVIPQLERSPVQGRLTVAEIDSAADKCLAEHARDIGRPGVDDLAAASP
ncbi:hypothetical protein [Rhizobium mongolense]|uniref:hypothetical protein n=1 Tax=Rhizobium mongolense TaxID=57676 RepID=UPI001113674E|nr:hypothetical protein [Rhizobium mongolense]